MWDACCRSVLDVSGRLRKQLGAFLRRQRGDASYAEFARKTGLSRSSLQRLELGEQNITIDTLEELLKRFGCRLSDVFPE